MRHSACLRQICWVSAQKVSKTEFQTIFWLRHFWDSSFIFRIVCEHSRIRSRALLSDEDAVRLEKLRCIICIYKVALLHSGSHVSCCGHIHCYDFLPVFDEASALYLDDACLLFSRISANITVQIWKFVFSSYQDHVVLWLPIFTENISRCPFILFTSKSPIGSDL